MLPRFEVCEDAAVTRFERKRSDFLALLGFLDKPQRSHCATVSSPAQRYCSWKFDYFFDPAPLAENVYADLLKILDSNRGMFPIDPTALPSPEFVAASMSKFGICVSMYAYYMAFDLHSPTVIAIPLMVGSTFGMQQQAAAPKPTPKKAIH